MHALPIQESYLQIKHDFVNLFLGDTICGKINFDEWHSIYQFFLISIKYVTGDLLVDSLKFSVPFVSSVMIRQFFTLQKIFPTCGILPYTVYSIRVSVVHSNIRYKLYTLLVEGCFVC